MRHPYTARELSVNRGERLVVEQEYAGWLFVRNKAGARGWVPVSHVRLVDAGTPPQPPAG